MFAAAHARALLILAAAAPFIPAVCQFVHRGVPDVLFTGDGAALELRTLHAARGAELLGPYSRFHWSHPGPAFFYLALPFYQLFHHHGPALNLFVLIANLASAVALVLTARRVRGDLFALAVAALLAVYEGVGAPFQLSGEWNPVVPILPFALLTFLAVRLGVSGVGVLPVFAFVASAIVQTHVGFLPVTLAAAAVAAGFDVRARLAAPPPGPASPRLRSSPRRDARVAAATVAVLLLVWLPPLVENATGRPGNLERLWQFFTGPHPVEHRWRIVIDTVAHQLAVMPIAALGTFGITVSADDRLALGLGALQTAALVCVMIAGLRRRDQGCVVLAVVALAEIVAAIAAVRSIRDEIFPYLVAWVSVLGMVSMAALAAWAVPVFVRALGPGVGRAGVAVPAVVALALAVRLEARRVDVFRARDADTERLAAAVAGYLDEQHVDRPIVRIATNDLWPTATAVVLYLGKRGIPVYVERDWLFIVGRQYAAPSTGHPLLLIGGNGFCETASGRRDLRPIASVTGACALLGDPDYLPDHRIDGKVELVSSTGARTNPALAVDGVVPVQGTSWNSPLSVILSGTDSAIEVAVPRNAPAMDGVFLSVDGNDTYAVSCVHADGARTPLGDVRAEVPLGMGTVFLFTDELPSCDAVSVSPSRGDGYYSIGEIGFLKR